MKNKTLILARILLKNGGGFGIKDNKNRVSAILLLLFIGILAPGMAVLFSLFLAGAYDAMAAIGQEGVIVSWGIAAVSVIIFIFGIFYVVSSFYFSMDVENLLHLPLKPRQITGAKFLVIMIYEYLITAVIFLPVLLVYGVKSGAGPLFFVYGIVVFLFIPVVPLVAASILAMVVMRFTNLKRHKDTFKLLGGLLALALGLGINIIIQRFGVNIAEGDLERILERGQNSLAGITSGMFPNVRWAVKSMLESHSFEGLSNLALYMAVSLLAYIVLIYLGEKIYFRGVVGISEAASRRSSFRRGELDKALVKGSVVKTYTITEIKLLFRTPVYFINCVLINFIWPVLLLLPFLTKSEDMDLLRQLSALMGDPQYSGKVLLGVFAFILFQGGTNPITPTAISREGQELFVKKYLPVDYKDQIRAKVLSGFIMGNIGLVILVLFAVIMFKMPISLVLVILAIGWMPMLLLSYTGILIDLYNPKPTWDNEQKAVKQNLNVMYNMVIGMILAALTVLALVRLDLALPLASLLMVAVYGILNVLICRLVYTRGAGRFFHLEG